MKLIEKKECRCITPEFELDYYIIENENIFNSSFRYGVGIHKRINGIVREVAVEYNLFATRNRSEQFIQVLAENLVTPATLHDIVMDFA